jgi:hypothetical protein
VDEDKGETLDDLYSVPFGFRDKITSSVYFFVCAYGIDCCGTEGLNIATVARLYVLTSF